MRTPWKSALFLASCSLAGCTSTDSEDAGRDLASSHGSLALLSFERGVDAQSDQPRLSAGAKVARFRGIDGDGLLKLLGAELRDLETCGPASGLEERVVGANAEVDLLSVGPIAVRAGATRTQLEPRLFPALAATAAGWFYAGAVELPVGSLGSEELVLSAGGEGGLGRFELAAAAPQDVQGVALAGTPLEEPVSEAKGAAAPVVVSRADALELTWEPDAQGDRVEIEVFAGGSVLSCAARDDGQFVLSRAQLRALEADDNASLVLRRVRVLPLEMAGVETAYVRLAATRTASLSVK